MHLDPPHYYQNVAGTIYSNFENSYHIIYLIGSLMWM